MTSSLVSIITPTLNQGTFIEQTLASVTAQTYESIEHIVIDGGSTDHTLEILARWQHERPDARRWLSEPDRGMYDAINKGLALARGEVVAYLNSDDVYFPWSVETAVHSLANAEDRPAVYGDAVELDIANGAMWIIPAPPPCLPCIARFGSLQQPSVFWRGDIGARFDPTLRLAGDLDFWLTVSRRAMPLRINEVLALARVHPNALSTAQASTMTIESRTVRARHAGQYHARHTMLGRAHLGLDRRIRLAALAASMNGARGSGWRQFAAATGPRASTLALALSLLPVAGRHIRDRVFSWRQDPLSAAAGSGDSYLD